MDRSSWGSEGGSEAVHTPKVLRLNGNRVRGAGSGRHREEFGDGSRELC